MIKIGLLVVIAMFTPTGLVYSPAAKTSPVHKPPAITAPVKTAPAATSAVDYISKPAAYGSPVHKKAAPAPETVGSPLATPAADGSAETPAAPSSDKYDGDCQPTATVGRCADKCPGATSEGVYYLQGYDKETGAAVCGFSYYHECPYATAVSADDPLCAKLGEEQQ